MKSKLCIKWALCGAMGLASPTARADLLVAQIAPVSGPIAEEGTACNSGIVSNNCRLVF
jgi:hypothetical protein